MTSNPVLQARSLTPFSTISGTVIDGRTMNLFLYETVSSNPPRAITTLGLNDLLSGISATIAASVASAVSAVTKETHQVTLITTVRPVASVHTVSVGRVAPELVPIGPAVIATRTATDTVTTTASADNANTEKPFLTNPHENSISINVTTSNPTQGGSMSPNVIVGIVFGVVMGLVVATVLVGLLLRKRRRTRHSSSRHDASNPSPPSAPIPMYVVPRPAEPPSEMPWPSLPNHEYFAPKKMDEEDEVPHQLPKRRRMSGETFTEEARVGHET